MPITIRPAQPEDVRPAFDLALRIFIQFPSDSLEYFRSVCEDPATHEHYITGRRRMFVAVDRDQLVGMACEGGCGYVDKLYVDPAYHRKGIATALLNALIAAMGVPRVTLNATPCALPFYTRYGFAPTGGTHPVVPTLTPMAYEPHQKEAPWTTNAP